MGDEAAAAFLLYTPRGNMGNAPSGPTRTTQRITPLYLSTLERLFSFRVDPEALFEDEVLISSDRSENPYMTHYPYAHHADELAACLRGEEYDTEDVCALLGQWRAGSKIRDCIRERGNTTTFSFQCTDGVYTASEAMLRRRFQLIDDYVEDTGDLHMSLPYSAGEVHDAVNARVELRLATCYDALLHLNPKSNLYPFYYDMEDITMEQVSYLASRITEEERDQLFLTLNRDTHLKLPSHTTPMLLASFPSFRRPTPFTARLFQAYPSFYFKLWCGVNCIEGQARLFLDWLMTADFTRDASTLCHRPHGVIRELVNCVISVLSEIAVSDEELGYLMALLGVRHGSLKNMETKVLLPYDLLPPILPPVTIGEIVANLHVMRSDHPIPLNQIAMALDVLR